MPDAGVLDVLDPRRLLGVERWLFGQGARRRPDAVGGDGRLTRQPSRTMRRTATLWLASTLTKAIQVPENFNSEVCRSEGVGVNGL